MVNGIMQPILDKLLEIITSPIIKSMDETFDDAIDKIEGLKEQGIDLGEDSNVERLRKQQEDARNELIKKTKARLKKFGSAMSLLIDGVKTLALRLASIPAAVISATPVGPGVSPNLVLPLLYQLKGEGDNLSKVYDDAKASWDELGLEEMELDNEGKEYIALVLATIGTFFGLASVACTLVGSGVDGKEATLPTVEIPAETPEYLPSDCQNYTPDSAHTTTESKECRYCTRFVHTTPEKSIYEFQDTEEKTAQEQYDEWYAAWVAENRDSFTCNNCKFFKK